MKQASETKPEKKPAAEDDFASQADEAQMGIVAEFFDFLLHNKKWWLTPIVVVLLLLTLLAFFSATPAAPFIYTLF